jgi:hypothetical protein
VHYYSSVKSKERSKYKKSSKTSLLKAGGNLQVCCMGPHAKSMQHLSTSSLRQLLLKNKFQNFLNKIFTLKFIYLFILINKNKYFY